MRRYASAERLNGRAFHYRAAAGCGIIKSVWEVLVNTVAIAAAHYGNRPHLAHVADEVESVGGIQWAMD